MLAGAVSPKMQTTSTGAVIRNARARARETVPSATTARAAVIRYIHGIHPSIPRSVIGYAGFGPRQAVPSIVAPRAAVVGRSYANWQRNENNRGSYGELVHDLFSSVTDCRKRMSETLGSQRLNFLALAHREEPPFLYFTIRVIQRQGFATRAGPTSHRSPGWHRAFLWRRFCAHSQMTSAITSKTRSVRSTGCLADVEIAGFALRPAEVASHQRGSPSNATYGQPQMVSRARQPVALWPSASAVVNTPSPARHLTRSHGRSRLARLPRHPGFAAYRPFFESGASLADEVQLLCDLIG
jgi:hypothetical protein